MHLPPLNALTVFEVVGRHQSIRRAAEELCVTPSAVSRQIKLLEDYIGIPLFLRSNRKISFTEEGINYWKVVHKFIGDLESESNKFIQEYHGRHLVVGCSQLFLRNWLIPRLPKFYERFPDINLTLKGMHSSQPIDSSVDCRILVGKGYWAGMSSEFLIDAHLELICSPAYLETNQALRSVEDLRNHTLIDSNKSPNRWHHWLGEHAEAVLEKAKIIDVDGPGVAYKASLDGLGMSLVRATLVEQDVIDGRLIIPHRRKSRSDDAYYFVYFKQRQKPPGFDKFHNWIKEEIKKYILSSPRSNV